MSNGSPTSMSTVSDASSTTPPQSFRYSPAEEGLAAKVAAVSQAAYRGLEPSDWRYLRETSRLLALRDTSPSVCAGEAWVLMSDTGAPRCWRARAGVYRAEALMRLGFVHEARRALRGASRLLDKPLEPEECEDGHGGKGGRYEMLEALVAWNIAMGKINWGIADADIGAELRTRSGTFFSAGWPSSHLLSALDLKY